MAQNKAQNKMQHQRGLSMPKFFDRYGSPEQCEVLVWAWHCPEGVACYQHRITLREREAQRVFAAGSAVLPVPFLPLPMRPGQRHRLQVQQAAAAHLGSRHALNDAGQEQRLGAKSQARPGNVLSHRLAARAQDHGGDGQSRAVAATHRLGRDQQRGGRRLPRRRGAGRQG